MSIKWIYLAKRNPSTDHMEFRKRWREHSMLASQFAATMGQHFAGVRQCAKIQLGELPAELVNDYDGVALLRLRSMQDLRDVWSDPDANRTMIPDEPRVFSTQVMNFSLFAQEWVEFDRGEGSFALLSFVKRIAGISRTEFVANWRDRHAPLVLTVPSAEKLVRSYRQNHVFRETPPGYGYDGVGELWFEDANDALALLRDPVWRGRIGGDLAAFTEPAAATTLLIEVTHRKS